MKTATKKPTLKQVRESAGLLGKADRRRLLAYLQTTLEPKPVDDMDDAELEAELNRRHAEALRDPSIMIPGAVVFEEIRKKYL